MQKLQAGDLNHKVGFYSRGTSDDGFGNTESVFDTDPEFTCAANLRPRLGGETVLAQRLTGTNVVNVTVRQSSLTRMVGVAWRLRDERTGTLYNIRSIIDPDEGDAGQGRWLEMLCETGVAT